MSWSSWLSSAGDYLVDDHEFMFILVDDHEFMFIIDLEAASATWVAADEGRIH